MKVCMISYSEPHDSRVLRYIMALRSRGDVVDYVCLSSSVASFHLNDPQIRVYPIYSRKYNEQTPLGYFRNLFSFFLRSFYWVTLLYYRNRYHVLHFHNIPDFGVFCTIIPKWFGSAKVILDIHDLVPEFYMQKFHVQENHWAIRILKWIEKLACRYADHVITVTDIWRERLTRSIPKEKCTVILNAPDRNLFKPVSDSISPQKGFWLSYHGNLSEHSGLDVLLEAFSQVALKIPKVYLQILGHPEKIKLYLKWIQTPLLKDRVYFVPSVPVTEVPKYLSSMDIGIDPKKDGVYSGETLSVKAMEYLAMGIPLIVSATPAAKQYFNPEMVCFFKPNDPVDLANCIVKLYHSSALRRKLREKGNRFFESYDWEKYKTQYFSLLKRLAYE